MAYEGAWIPPGTPIQVDQLEWLAEACNARFGTSYTFENGQWLTNLERVAGTIVKSLSHPSPLISGGQFDNRLKAINTSLLSNKTRQNDNIIPSFGFSNLLHPVSLRYISPGSFYRWPVKTWQYGGVGQNITEAFAENLHVFSLSQTHEIRVRSTGTVVETSTGIPCSQTNIKGKFMLSGFSPEEVFFHKIITSPISRKDCGIYDPENGIRASYGYTTWISRSSYIIGNTDINVKAFSQSVAGLDSDVILNVGTTCINQVASFSDAFEDLIIPEFVGIFHQPMFDYIAISIPKASSTNRTFRIFSNGKNYSEYHKKQIAELTIAAGSKFASAEVCIPIIIGNWQSPWMTIEGDMEDGNNPYISAPAYGGSYLNIGIPVVNDYMELGFMLLREDLERLDLGLQLSYGPLSAHLFNELADLVQA